MTRTFKATEEKSKKMIETLQAKYEMARDEKVAQAEAFDKRLNTLIRDFVKIYKKLADEFVSYKDFVKWEIDLGLIIAEGKNKLIEKLEYQI